MQWDFEEVPVSLWTEDKALFQAGFFDGSFEIDEIGMIQTITLKEHQGNGSITLKRWKQGEPVGGDRDRLFQMLERALSKRYEDKINECLADLHEWPSVVDQREADRAIYHQSVL